MMMVRSGSLRPFLFHFMASAFWLWGLPLCGDIDDRSCNSGIIWLKLKQNIVFRCVAQVMSTMSCVLLHECFQCENHCCHSRQRFSERRTDVMYHQDTTKENQGVAGENSFVFDKGQTFLCLFKSRDSQNKKWANSTAFQPLFHFRKLSVLIGSKLSFRSLHTQHWCN